MSEDTRRVIYMCGLCLGTDSPGMLISDDIEVEYCDACSECQKDLFGIIPNLARFGARLRVNLDSGRVADYFGMEPDDANLKLLWTTWMQCVLHYVEARHIADVIATAINRLR